jgi:hypothetical protein
LPQNPDHLGIPPGEQACRLAFRIITEISPLPAHQVIDWLMGKAEGRVLLEKLNFEGLTPFTLAARYGRVIYNFTTTAAKV